MLTIRLRRTGKKGQPLYRIVVADERTSVYGNYLEMIGTYNPKTKAVTLDNEKALKWMTHGAKPSNTVSKIFQKEGVKHNSVVIKKFRAVSKKELEAQKVQEEKAKAEEAAKKEKAKEAFEAQVEAEKAAAPKEDKLHEMAEESIADVKSIESEKEAAKASPDAKAEPASQEPAQDTKEN
ncbi:MAG: 30S ribosomal protein S16 [Patescibacteria group bacterium]|jgi:small subunit ribosomal protein S16